MMLRCGGEAEGKKTDERQEMGKRSREEKCNEDVGYRSQKGKRVMDIHLAENCNDLSGEIKSYCIIIYV